MNMKGYNSDFTASGNQDNSNGLENGVDYNRAGSSSVREVNSEEITIDAHNVHEHGIANSVTKNYRKGHLSSERYYDSNGNAYLDIDYTNHGNAKMHPHVPHQHKIRFVNGKMIRDNTETEVK